MDSVFEIKNFISNTYCQYIVNKFDEDVKNHTSGLVMNDMGYILTQNTLKKGTDLDIGDKTNWNNDLHKIIKIIFKGMNHYLNFLKSTYNYEFNSFFSNIKLTTPVIQKTEVGEYFNWHTDSNINNSRLVACIIYLNDVEEKCGGRTEFCHRKIKPSTGTIIFFPATWEYIHRGETLTKGKKYIITCFFERSKVDQILEGCPFLVTRT